MVIVGSLNTLALIVFTVALCWRLDQIRRHGGGLQAVAMTVSIAALTLAFVVANHDVSEAIDTLTFTGAQRVTFYALLAIGVAALIIVFFFGSRGVSRERRAGIEAVPLVVALIGLQVTMLLTPVDVRTDRLSDMSVREVGFALFFLIASGYLVYGFLSCARSVRKFVKVADGYLRVSLTVVALALGLLVLGSLAQILFVLLGVMGFTGDDWLLSASTILSAAGVVGFLLGVSYPMLHARWRSMMARRRSDREDRELKPLWSLVTEAIPEVVLPSKRRYSARVRLHRRVVETRDALTQLSPALPADFEAAEPDTQAAMLRAAVQEYVDGGPVRGPVRDILPSQGSGIHADVAPLLRLARGIESSGATISR